MEEMTLSTKEFLLAAASLGAKNFFGISDPFYGMTAEEIQSECQNLQCSLEKKGYATVDFEGSFELMPEAASLISSCIKCRSYLLVQLGEVGKVTHQFLAYASESGLVGADVQGQDISLRRMDKESVVPSVLEKIQPPASGSGERSRAVVKQADLAQVQSLAVDEPEKAVEQLLDKGCPRELASVLVQGFRKEAGRYLLFRTDVCARALTEMVVIQSAAGAVCMTLEDLDEDLWQAEFLPGGITEEALKDLCTLEGAGHEML